MQIHYKGVKFIAFICLSLFLKLGIAQNQNIKPKAPEVQGLHILKFNNQNQSIQFARVNSDLIVRAENTAPFL
jgi:hypothetical protein